MKKILVYGSLIFLVLYSCDVAQNVVKVLEEENSPLTEQEVVKGLKEALRIGTDTAVNIVSAVNGYYGDQLIRIHLPKEANAILKYKDNPMMKAAGISALIDNAVVRLNRAAEHAAKSATPIFVNAIKSMTIADAFQILNGPDTAATHYFRQKTYAQLKKSFKPKIKNSLDQPLAGKVSASKAWNTLTGTYNDIASITGWEKVNTQLDEYVTQKALNGLFLKVSQQEIAIRKDPKARVTEILKRVFGKN